MFPAFDLYYVYIIQILRNVSERQVGVYIMQMIYLICVIYLIF